MSMNEEQLIQRDRMRFTKNTLSSGLALLAILFNVLYFVSIYKSDVGSYYYNILMGASVLYNLIFMLVVFLSSEGVKSYKAAFLTQVDFEALKKHAEMWKTAYVDSTFWFDAHYAVFAVLLAVTVLLLLNLIWKIRLMKAEKRLIEAGKEAKA